VCRQWLGYALALVLAFGIALALIKPTNVQAYGNTAGHPIIASEALELVRVPELRKYADSVRHGATDEDRTDHVYGLPCWDFMCSCAHFWDADGNHGYGPGGPYDTNRCLRPNGNDCFANAFVKGRELFYQAKAAYLAGNKPQAYEYLGHVAHLLA